MFDRIKYVHFLGIGGIGMSALARYFKSLGKEISGYDKTQTSLTAQLQNEGMKIYFKEDLSLLPEVIKTNPGADEVLIIYTPAIPNDHIEIQFFKNQKVELVKRAQVLGMISREYQTISVAGTHGKTTTTSLLAWILIKCEIPFIGFIGGINENLGTNLIVQENPKYMLTEADEYDRSFLQLKNTYAIITSMDADHLDIYGSDEIMQESFIEFSKQVPASGLFVNEKIKGKMPVGSKSYGLNPKADFHPENISFEEGNFNFSFSTPEKLIPGFKLSMPGHHNLENATAAIALSLQLGADEAKLKEALQTYKGVKRRFEYHIKTENFVYIDDYAHHPEEISALVGSVKKMYPNRKITGVFQPHLFSRTRDFGDAFARSLEMLDQVILLEIYPAREKAIEGIDSSWLLSKIQLKNKELCSKYRLLDCLDEMNPDILLTIGAGDIDQCVSSIKNHYTT